MKILAQTAKRACSNLLNSLDLSSLTRKASLVAVTTLALTSNSAFAATATNSLSEKEKLYGLNLIRKETTYNYAFFDRVPALEFEKAYKESVARVLKTKSDLEYYQELQRFVALLKNSNTRVELPNGLVDFPPMKIEESEQQAVITAVSEEYAKKVPLGSIVLGINGKALDKVLREQVFPRTSASSPYAKWEGGIEQVLGGQPDSRVSVVYLTKEGRIGSVSMRRNAQKEQTKLVNASGVVKNNQNFQSSMLNKNIAYINLGNEKVSSTSSQIKQARSLLRKAKGVVIDLRFSQTNSSQLAAVVLPYLTTAPLSGPSWKTRIRSTDVNSNGHPVNLNWSGSRGARIAPNKSGVKKALPMIFLVSRDMGRGAENLLGYVHQMRNVLLLGEVSADSTVKQVEFPLPGGGRLAVNTQRAAYSDQIDYAGFGIQPDYMVKRDTAFFISSEDVMLQQAVTELQRRL